MPTRRWHWIMLGRFSFRVFRIYKGYHWPGTVGKAPGGDRAPGRGGDAGHNEQRAERLNDKLGYFTSPSHRFLPLLQLVQARAPLFGIWVDDCCCDGDSAFMFVSVPPVRLLFDADSDSLETDAVGLSDMKMWARNAQNVARAIILGRPATKTRYRVRVSPDFTPPLHVATRHLIKPKLKLYSLADSPSLFKLPPFNNTLYHLSHRHSCNISPNPPISFRSFGCRHSPISRLTLAFTRVDRQLMLLLKRSSDAFGSLCGYIYPLLSGESSGHGRHPATSKCLRSPLEFQNAVECLQDPLPSRDKNDSGAYCSYLKGEVWRPCVIRVVFTLPVHLRHASLARTTARLLSSYLAGSASP